MQTAHYIVRTEMMILTQSRQTREFLNVMQKLEQLIQMSRTMSGHVNLSIETGRLNIHIEQNQASIHDLHNFDQLIREFDHHIAAAARVFWRWGSLDGVTYIGQYKDALKREDSFNQKKIALLKEGLTLNQTNQLMRNARIYMHSQSLTSIPVSNTPVMHVGKVS